MKLKPCEVRLRKTDKVKDVIIRKRDPEFLRAWRSEGGRTPRKNSKINFRAFSKIVHLNAKKKGVDLKKSSPTLPFWIEIVEEFNVAIDKQTSFCQNQFPGTYKKYRK